MNQITYLMGAVCAAGFSAGYAGDIFTGAETCAALLFVAVITISIYRGKV